MGHRGLRPGRFHSIKGIFDYAGTYLVSYAGFGMITDLRDDMYNAILRRSAAFFQKHTTGTLLSTLINDLERVQFSMSSVLGEFLQQFFTLIFTVAAVVLLGGKLAWVLLSVPARDHFFVEQDRPPRSPDHAPRPGQARRNPEHPARNHHRQPHREGLRHGDRGKSPASAPPPSACSAPTFVPWRLPPSSSPLMDTFGAIAIALLLLLGRNEIRHGSFTPGTYLAFIALVFKLYEPIRKFALFNNSFQQAVGASSEIFKIHRQRR